MSRSKDSKHISYGNNYGGVFCLFQGNLLTLHHDRRILHDHGFGRGPQAADCGEIPVGAVVVLGGRVVGKGHNLTQALGDVTAHAEIQAITAAASLTGSKYLPDATLYVTVEPCLMCAGAIGWAQIGRVVIGCDDDKRGYRTYTSKSPFHPRCQVVRGVCETQSRALMQSFFKQKRK